LRRDSTTRILITLCNEYVEVLDSLIAACAGSSRSELIEKIPAGFFSDLRKRRSGEESALGSLNGFIVLLVGVSGLASILEGLFEAK